MQFHPSVYEATAPAVDIVAVSACDSVNFDYLSRSIEATGAGNVVAVMQGGETRTIPFAAGQIRVMACSRVNFTSTTATGIYAHF